MFGLIEQHLYVLIHSGKTLWTLSIDLTFFLLIIMLGDYFIASADLAFAQSMFHDLILNKIIKQYDKAAISILIGSIFLSIKVHTREYRKHI